MAKAFLLRFGTESDFGSIKLQTRELGVAVDSEKLYLGFDDKNVFIPNESQVVSIIDTNLHKYRHTIGTTLELVSAHKDNTIAFDTTLKRLKYKNSGTTISIASKSEVSLPDPVSFVVETGNIDTNDGDNVLLAGFSRPMRNIFKNGLLCTKEATDTNRYTFDNTTLDLKVYGCVAGDIISYL